MDTMENTAILITNNDDTKERFELINGKIIMMSPRPRIDHLTVCGNIFSEFRHYLKGKSCRAFGDGADVYLDEKNHFIPDAMIICNKNIIKDNYIDGAPDLVVEVLSPSTAKNDRFRKKFAYEQAGVKEYWIVDVFYKFVEVYINLNNVLILDKIYYYYSDEELKQTDSLPHDEKIDFSNKIKVSICDNLILNLKDIFDNI